MGWNHQLDKIVHLPFEARVLMKYLKLVCPPDFCTSNNIIHCILAPNTPSQHLHWWPLWVDSSWWHWFWLKPSIYIYIHLCPKSMINEGSFLDIAPFLSTYIYIYTFIVVFLIWETGMFVSTQRVPKCRHHNPKKASWSSHVKSRLGGSDLLKMNENDTIHFKQCLFGHVLNRFYGWLHRFYGFYLSILFI